MAELSERLARLEGVQEHLATKADLAQLRVEIASIDGQLETLIWAIPLTVAVVTAILQYFVPHRKTSAQ